MDSINISEEIRIFTLISLVTLRDFLKNISPSAEVPAASIKFNLHAVISAINKFESCALGLSSQECKVVYMAVRERRDEISSELDSEANPAVREVLVDDFRKANHTLRFWRNALLSSESGRAILGAFD